MRPRAIPMRKSWQVRAMVGLLVLLGTLVLGSTWIGAEAPEKETEKVRSWEVYAVNEVLAERAASGRRYLSFLEVPALHAGVYVLPAGATDEQSAHDEDEIYYVLEGRAGFTVDGEETRAKPGDVIYVKAGADHRFHSIEEDLKLLVLFSTAASD